MSALLVATGHATELVWAYTNFEPYVSSKDKQPAQGWLIDLMDCISSKQAVNYRAVNFSNMRASQVNQHEANFAVSIKEFIPQNGQYLFSEQAVANVVLQSYWLGDKPAITQWSDIKDKKIIVLRGYSYGGGREYINQASNNVMVTSSVETHERGLQALIKGRGDYFIGYQGPTEFAKQAFDNLTLHSAKIQSSAMHFVLSKRVEQAEMIMEKLELGLTQCANTMYDPSQEQVLQ